MKVAFFTEAGSKRGMGHLIRSQCIADEFRRHGNKVDFYLDSDVDYSYKFDGLLSFSWDFFRLEKNYDTIFIDSYEANIKIYEEISLQSKVAVYIDDFERLDYPKGIVINFAPKAKDLFFKNKNKLSKYLLGTKYIPIREVFSHYEKKDDNKIFIMLGGNDIKDLSIQIIKSLININFQKFVVTNNIKTYEKLKNMKNVFPLYQPSDNDLIEQMSKAKVAITTASMSVYELAYFNISTIILAISKNQNDGVSQLIECKVAEEFVDINKSLWKNDLLEKTKLLVKKKDKTSSIDSKGCSRIYNHVMEWINKCKKY